MHQRPQIAIDIKVKPGNYLTVLVPRLRSKRVQRRSTRLSAPRAFAHLSRQESRLPIPEYVAGKISLFISMPQLSWRELLPDAGVTERNVRAYRHGQLGERFPEAVLVEEAAEVVVVVVEIVGVVEQDLGFDEVVGFAVGGSIE